MPEPEWVKPLIFFSGCFAGGLVYSLIALVEKLRDCK